MAVPGATSGLEHDHLDAELARVNVLRLRGQYDEAKALGISVLQLAPTHADALSLMGDIASEMGEMESAERYYRLALDHNPGSPVETRKLAAIRKRIDDHRAAETAKKLGLSSGGPQVAILVATTMIFVVALGIVGYTVGSRARSEAPPTPLHMTMDVAKPKPATRPKTEPKPVPKAELPVQVPDAAEDAMIAKAIQDRTPHGPRLAGALSDPRDRSAVLTFRVEAPFSKEQLASLAIDALNAMPEVRRTVVRTLIQGEFAMIGELKRESLEKVKSGETLPADALENFWDRTQAGG